MDKLGSDGNADRSGNTDGDNRPPTESSGGRRFWWLWMLPHRGKLWCPLQEQLQQCVRVP